MDVDDLLVNTRATANYLTEHSDYLIGQDDTGKYVLSFAAEERPATLQQVIDELETVGGLVATHDVSRYHPGDEENPETVSVVTDSTDNVANKDGYIQFNLQTLHRDDSHDLAIFGVYNRCYGDCPPPETLQQFPQNLERDDRFDSFLASMDLAPRRRGWHRITPRQEEKAASHGVDTWESGIDAAFPGADASVPDSPLYDADSPGHTDIRVRPYNDDWFSAELRTVWPVTDPTVEKPMVSTLLEDLKELSYEFENIASNTF